MTRREEKVNQRSTRFQFSIRKVVIVLVFFCLYLGTWEPTRKYGTVIPPQDPLSDKQSFTDHIFIDRSEAIAPMLVAQNEVDFSTVQKWIGMWKKNPDPRIDEGPWIRPRRYYIWLLGPKIRLPFESSW